MAMEVLPFNYSTKCTEKCWSKFIDGKLQCDCSNDIRIYEWFWEKDEAEHNFKLDRENLVVTFHPRFSAGTSIVRGDKPFKRNMHYYWELKMISKLYGTDVMIGIGTNLGVQNLKDYRYRFCSVLGSDDQTWGYSYHGIIQHNSLIRKYGPTFGLSSTVGVHLDMYSGKLEYYLNRKPLGVAFTGLKNEELYPIACATAAESSMKLTCAVSQTETLQMLCLKNVHQNYYLYDKYRSIPGLYKSCSEKYFWMIPPVFGTNLMDEEEELYILAMNNNSNNCPKRKQNMTCLVGPQSNKKVSTESSFSLRDIASRLNGRTSPVIMEIDTVELLSLIISGAICSSVNPGVP